MMILLCTYLTIYLGVGNSSPQELQGTFLNENYLPKVYRKKPCLKVVEYQGRAVGVVCPRYR